VISLLLKLVLAVLEKLAELFANTGEILQFRQITIFTRIACVIV